MRGIPVAGSGVDFDDLQIIAPEIVGVLRSPADGGLTLSVAVGSEVRIITIPDRVLALVRGDEALIDVIRSAVEQAKAGATKYKELGVGGMRAEALNQRLGYSERSAPWLHKTPKPSPAIVPIEAQPPPPPPPPPKRFELSDGDFAGRIRTKQLEKLRDGE